MILVYPPHIKIFLNYWAKNGFIDKTLEKELSRLVFYRNLLSHGYYDLTDKDIFDLLGRIGVIKQFMEKMKELLK